VSLGAVELRLHSREQWIGRRRGSRVGGSFVRGSGNRARRKASQLRGQQPRGRLAQAWPWRITISNRKKRICVWRLPPLRAHAFHEGLTPGIPWTLFIVGVMREYALAEEVTQITLCPNIHPFAAARHAQTRPPILACVLPV